VIVPHNNSSNKSLLSCFFVIYYYTLHSRLIAFVSSPQFDMKEQDCSECNGRNKVKPEKHHSVPEGLLEDITQNFRNEIDLPPIDHLVSNLPAGIYRTDGNGRILYANPGLAAILGYATAEEAMANGNALAHHISAESRRHQIEKWRMRDGYISEEIPMKRLDGSLIWVRDTGRVFFDANGQIDFIDGIITDITRQKKEQVSLHQTGKILKRQNRELVSNLKHVENINLQLREAKEKAEESDRFKSAFLANMSHEIRTPMNSIMGFADLMRQMDLTPEKIKQFADIIYSNCDQLLNLINDIIDLSKIEAGELSLRVSPTNVNNLLTEMHSLLSVTAALKGITLRKPAYPRKANPVVITDATKLRQVMSNLLGNAIKFTPTGEVEFGYTVKGPYLEFYVKDQGIGIDPKYHRLIFERFKQVQNDLKTTKGTGLGLAISKSLVEMLGGRIWVESAPDRGSTFRFTLPNEQPVSDAENETETQTPKGKSSFRGKRILIAEDEESVAEYFNFVLKDTHADLVYVRNGLEAIDYVKSGERADLILMDLKMPILDGFKATKAIKEENPNIPIIAQTALAMSNERERAFGAGCDDYITKPINRAHLLDLIAKYLG